MNFIIGGNLTEYTTWICNQEVFYLVIELWSLFLTIYSVQVMDFHSTDKELSTKKSVKIFSYLTDNWNDMLPRFIFSLPLPRLSTVFFFYVQSAICKWVFCPPSFVI